MRFNPNARLIIAPAALVGPDGSRIVRLALDTGSSRTLVNPGALGAVGYSSSELDERVRVTGITDTEQVPVVLVRRLISLKIERSDFAVLAHALPANLRIDGLLGLDFLRGYELLIDFRQGKVELA